MHVPLHPGHAAGWARGVRRLPPSLCLPDGRPRGQARCPSAPEIRLPPNGLPRLRARGRVPHRTLPPPSARGAPSGIPGLRDECSVPACAASCPPCAPSACPVLGGTPVPGPGPTHSHRTCLNVTSAEPRKVSHGCLGLGRRRSFQRDTGPPTAGSVPAQQDQATPPAWKTANPDLEEGPGQAAGREDRAGSGSFP